MDQRRLLLVVFCIRGDQKGEAKLQAYFIYVFAVKSNSLERLIMRHGQGGLSIWSCTQSWGIWVRETKPGVPCKQCCLSLTFVWKYSRAGNQAIHHKTSEGYFWGFLFPRFGHVFWISDLLLLCFSAALLFAIMLLCFSASWLFCFLLFCFSSFPCVSASAFLLLCFFASPLFCFSAVFCFFASQA